MVIPPAIGAADDLYAWLLRGLVEAGLADITTGGEVPADGAFSAASLYEGGGVDGVPLSFPGYDAGEKWVYRCVVAGVSVGVACPDTLFSHSYAGLAPAALGARILADARAHNQAFRAWRVQGGSASIAEMRAIPQGRGTAASGALVRFLETRYRSGQGLAAGPSQGWWVAASTPWALGQGISTGQGYDPTYRLKGEPPLHDRPEYRDYAASIRTLGAVMLVTASVSMVGAGLALTYAGFNVFNHRADIILTRGISGFQGLLTANAWPLAFFLTAMVFAICLIVAGLRMRALRNLLLVRVLLVMVVVPCSGACCLVGLPVAGWALYRLSDEKAAAVFGRSDR
ncbi:MAG: hypothetical protein EXR71_04685 [Myxococcales bacterium]|nr:hypothetical protein [Myxococcales bacterium]